MIKFMRRKWPAMSFAALCWVTAFGGEPPIVEALKLETPPTLDGKLDEASWKMARDIGSFSVIGEAKRSEDTRVKIAYDDTWLYFGVICRNDKLYAIRPNVFGHDRSTSGEDSLEIFLDPGTDGKMYYHYMLGYGGAKAERRVTNGGQNRDFGWNVPWRSAVEVQRDGWSAEIALPLYLIASFGDPAKVRFNVGRVKRVPRIDSQAVVVNEDKSLSVWAPIVASFHEPGKFGRLNNLALSVVKTPAQPRIEAVAVKPFRSENGKRFYDIEVSIRAYTPTPGNFRLAVVDKSFNGKVATTVKPIAVTGDSDAEFTVPVPVDSLSSRSVNVRLLPEKGEETLQDLAVEDISPLNIMTAYLNRNYYTTESEALAVCELGAPKELTDTLVLRAVAADGRVLGRRDKLSPEIAFAFAIGALPVGEQTITLELRNGEETFYALPLTLIKRAPKPGKEWKIDRVNRVVLDNGEPFFALGLITHSLKLEDNEKFKELADMGFNLLPCWQLTEPEKLKAYCDKADAYGMKYMAFIDDQCYKPFAPKSLDAFIKDRKDLERLKKTMSSERYSMTVLKCDLMCDAALKKLSTANREAIFREVYDATLPRIIAGAKACENSPFFAGYFYFDEPGDDNYFNQSAFGEALYRAINQADGYHPCAVNYSSYIPDGKQYADFMDILMTDPYWIPGGPKGRNSPNFVSAIVSETERRGQEKRLVTWTVPVAESWSGIRKRPITPFEQRAQTWLALIHGAKGLLYFAYNPDNPAMLSALKTLAGQVKTLAPAILGKPIRQTVHYFAAASAGDEKPNYKEVFFRPASEQYPNVQVRLFRYPTGQCLLLAANSATWAVETRFRVGGLNGEVRKLFDSSPVVTTNGAFSERLGPYATRAYVFAAPETDTPFAIDVYARHDPATVPPEEVAYPNNCRSDRKNLLPNPSFEQVTPGCVLPDYYRSFWRCQGTIDTGDVFAGKNSVKLEWREGKPIKWQSVWLEMTLNNDAPCSYVFSFYGKADKPGVKVWCRALLPDCRRTETFTLSDKWERYSFSAVVSPGVSAYYEIRGMSSGVAWIDALQVEKGQTPTAFED